MRAYRPWHDEPPRDQREAAAVLSQRIPWNALKLAELARTASGAKGQDRDTGELPKSVVTNSQSAHPTRQLPGKDECA